MDNKEITKDEIDKLLNLDKNDYPPTTEPISQESFEALLVPVDKDEDEDEDEINY